MGLISEKWVRRTKLRSLKWDEKVGKLACNIEAIETLRHEYTADLIRCTFLMALLTLFYLLMTSPNLLPMPYAHFITSGFEVMGMIICMLMFMLSFETRKLLDDAVKRRASLR